MKIVFRTDASSEIGAGHVMRCLTLAKILKKRGFDCKFICRKLKGDFIKKIKKKNFEVITLYSRNQEKIVRNYDKSRSKYLKWLNTTSQNDAKQTIDALHLKKVDLLIVDHYSLDKSWEKKLKPYTSKIMVIDDLANRFHDCDFLLDQNLGSSKKRYKKLVPNKCKQFHGSKYVLINQIYASRKFKLKKRSGKINRIFIYFGSGNDSLKFIKMALKVFCDPELLNINLDIVSNVNSSDLLVIKQIAKKRGKCRIHLDLPDLSKLILKADLAIGAAGSTTWERCLAGLPSILIISDTNQELIAKSMKSVGAALILRPSSKFEKEFKNSVKLLRNDSSTYLKMSSKAHKICDGYGSERVAEEIISNFR